MKLSADFRANKYRLSQEGEFRWYHKDAKKIKQDSTYRHMLGTFWTPSVDTYEIYSILEKDKRTITYWLIEHKILTQAGKLEFIPLQQVYLDKKVDSRLGLWSVKLSKSVQIIDKKDLDELYKKIEFKKKKDKEKKKKK